MRSPKQAVNIVLDYLNSLYEGSNIQDPLLEEVEKSDDNKYWYITISFINPRDALSKFDMSIKRSYKQFRLNEETGLVESMTIRTLQ